MKPTSPFQSKSEPAPQLLFPVLGDGTQNKLHGEPTYEQKSCYESLDPKPLTTLHPKSLTLIDPQPNSCTITLSSTPRVWPQSIRLADRDYTQIIWRGLALWEKVEKVLLGSGLVLDLLLQSVYSFCYLHCLARLVWASGFGVYFRP